MNSFYDDNTIIIDPYYSSEAAYAVDFDYDLLGNPVAWNKRFLKAPLSMIRIYSEKYSWLITCCIFACLLITLCILKLVKGFPIILRVLWIAHKKRSELVAEMRVWEKRKRFMQRDDPDRYAAVYCRALANRLGVATRSHPVPTNLADYEAVRFVFPHHWLMDKTHQALQKVELDPSWNELVEGELEDTLKIAMKQKRLVEREPLSIVGRLIAKHMLAKGEDKSRDQSQFTREMLLLQGWEALYRERVKLATEENYYWWKSQDKRLPVEAREMVQHLQPIVTKTRQQKSLSGHDQVEALEQVKRDFQRLPHADLKAEVPGKRGKTTRASTPKIEISPPEFHRRERLMSRELDESIMLREILGMEHQHRLRLRRSRRRSSTRRSRRRTSKALTPPQSRLGKWDGGV
ncbi:hypothetical protein AHF37_02959 [Paragonimus kellicotti]|nr:hypothetical protein AHF37_02959 [Paragonimus kellicotti]